MESYLHEIKDIAYFLAAIYCPLTNQELIQYIVDGLDDDYDNFITTATYFRDHFTFDDLRTKLILYEPRVLRNRDDTSSVTTHHSPHNAFASGGHSANNWRGSGHNSRGGRNSHGRAGGRGRGQSGRRGSNLGHQNHSAGEQSTLA